VVEVGVVEMKRRRRWGVDSLYGRSKRAATENFRLRDNTRLEGSRSLSNRIESKGERASCGKERQTRVYVPYGRRTCVTTLTTQSVSAVAQMQSAY
jgi:hypothetical protein